MVTFGNPIAGLEDYHGAALHAPVAIQAAQLHSAPIHSAPIHAALVHAAPVAKVVAHEQIVSMKLFYVKLVAYFVFVLYYFSGLSEISFQLWR